MKCGLEGVLLVALAGGGYMPSTLPPRPHLGTSTHLVYWCRGDEKPAKGEDWEQEEFGKGDRKSSCVMVEHPAGSNVWYNGTPLKWTDTNVQFSLGGVHLECLVLDCFLHGLTTPQHTTSAGLGTRTGRWDRETNVKDFGQASIMQRGRW